MTIARILILLVCVSWACSTVKNGVQENRNWSFVETANTCEARHECAATTLQDKLYLVGGRGVKPVESFDPSSNKWSKLAAPPVEMHHFQAVSFKDELYVLGALTGGYPHEKPIPHIWIFNPTKNEWRKGADIPEDRRRGAAGVFVYKDKIYIVNGITDGHWDGHVAWFDAYDLLSNKWSKLPDSPRPRDHFQATLVDNKLYIIGGRRSSAKTKEIFNLTMGEIDVFDFKTNTWQTLSKDKNLPTHRAGCTAIALGRQIVVIGGESGSQTKAHEHCEAFDTNRETWQALNTLKTGRHGTQAVLIKNKIYIAAGCANRGGTPEQNTIEIF